MTYVVAFKTPKGEKGIYHLTDCEDHNDAISAVKRAHGRGTVALALIPKTQRTTQ